MATIEPGSLSIEANFAKRSIDLLQSLGYAAVLLSPEELQGVDRKLAEDVMLNAFCASLDIVKGLPQASTSSANLV